MRIRRKDAKTWKRLLTSYRTTNLTGFILTSVSVDVNMDDTKQGSFAEISCVLAVNFRIRRLSRSERGGLFLHGESLLLSLSIEAPSSGAAVLSGSMTACNCVNPTSAKNHTAQTRRLTIIPDAVSSSDVGEMHRGRFTRVHSTSSRPLMTSADGQAGIPATQPNMAACKGYDSVGDSHGLHLHGVPTLHLSFPVQPSDRHPALSRPADSAE